VKVHVMLRLRQQGCAAVDLVRHALTGLEP
jgi:hypothetical protein